MNRSISTDLARIARLFPHAIPHYLGGALIRGPCLLARRTSTTYELFRGFGNLVKRRLINDPGLSVRPMTSKSSVTVLKDGVTHQMELVCRPPK